MELRGMNAEAKGCPDLLVRQAFCKQAEHLQLARGERGSGSRARTTTRPLTTARSRLPRGVMRLREKC